MTDPLVESHNLESANLAAVQEEARQKAQAAQMAEVVDSRLEAFFQRGIDGKRFYSLKDGKMADTERFDFICDDIAGIHSKMDLWDATRVTKEDFGLLKQTAELTNKIVFGAIAFVCIAFLGGLVALVIKS